MQREVVKATENTDPSRVASLSTAFERAWKKPSFVVEVVFLILGLALSCLGFRVQADLAGRLPVRETSLKIVLSCNEEVEPEPDVIVRPVHASWIPTFRSAVERQEQEHGSLARRAVVGARDSAGHLLLSVSLGASVAGCSKIAVSSNRDIGLLARKDRLLASTSGNGKPGSTMEFNPQSEPGFAGNFIVEIEGAVEDVGFHRKGVRLSVVANAGSAFDSRVTYTIGAPAGLEVAYLSGGFAIAAGACGEQTCRRVRDYDPEQLETKPTVIVWREVDLLAEGEAAAPVWNLLVFGLGIAVSLECLLAILRALAESS